MTNNDAHSIPAADEDRTGSSKKFIASAVGVIAIVALGLVLSLTTLLGGKMQPSPTTPAPVEASAAPTPATNDPSVCGLTGVEMTGTVVSAPPTKWVLVGTIAAPSIADHGPGRKGSEGLRSCYSRTPTGALLAAANYIAVVSNPSTTKAALTQLLAPGEGRDYALSQVGTLPASQSDLRMQIAGFQMVSYTGDLASVDLAFRTSAGTTVGQVVDVIWQSGDWKIRPSDTGNFQSPAHTLPNLTGYTPWSGA